MKKRVCMKSISFTLKPFSKTVIFVSSLFFAALCSAMEVSGTIRLKGSGANAANIGDAIIYFVPDQENTLEVEQGEFTISMARKQFVPRTMAVPVGSTIKVPNKDSISHNAFSPTKPNNFDLELYGRGEEKSFTVKDPGIIKIYCNVHYHMVAYVLSLNTPYHTRPTNDGKFSLEIPNQAGKLVVWHERTNEYTQLIKPDQKNIVDTSLKITKRRLPAHSNKFGRSYRRDRR